MHAIEPAPAGDAWAALGRDAAAAARGAGGVRALGDVGADAHRAIRSPRRSTISADFPHELYPIALPGAGRAGRSRREAVALLKSAGITAGVDGCRGLDHGAWVPLRWMYPRHGRAGGRDFAATRARDGAPRRARTGARAARRRRRADRRLRATRRTTCATGWRTRGGSEPLRYAQEFADWLHERLAAHDTDALDRLSRPRARRRARASDRGALAAAARRVGCRRRLTACRAYPRRLRSGLACTRFVRVPPSPLMRLPPARR